MLNDLRYALRILLANRLFAAMAMLSLALGIGANTAIYSLLDAILVKTLPVHDPESLVVLRWHSKVRAPIARNINGSLWNDPHYGKVSPNLPWQVYETFKKDNPALSHVAAYNNAWEVTALIQGQGHSTAALYVSGGFFDALGMPPAFGRLIGNDDDRDGAPPVALVSYGFAERRFGEAGKALGQTVTINDVPFTVVGVAAPGFHGINPGQERELYLPLQSQIQVNRIYGRDPRAKFADPKFYWVEILGRRKPGVSIEQAQAALTPIFDQFTTSQATNEAERANLPKLMVQDASRGLESLQRQYSKPLFILMTLVALILAIACANLANLLLARAAGRRREMAVRLSVGAAKGRIIRQLLTESVLLAALGATLGLLFAQWGLRGLIALMANGQQNFLLDASLNWRVLALTIGLALVTGVLFGLAPALQASKVDLVNGLKQTRAGETKRRVGSWLKVSLSQALVVTQITVSLLLLVAAGLFARTLSKLNSVELGFNRDHVLVFTVNAQQAGYRDQALFRFYGGLHERLAAIPGVKAATASGFPLVAQNINSSNVKVAGYTGTDTEVSFLTVAESFFETMQIPLLVGRPIDRRDISAGSKVAVVNEVFAKRFIGSENPIGKHFITGRVPNESQFEIIGVAKNARYHSLKDDLPPVAYQPYTHDTRGLGPLTFELRAAGDPMSLASAAREVVRQADARLPVTNLKTQNAVIEQTIGQERTFATLCTSFALLAVVIACVGLYGTMAYSVARRTNEIGLRMALGAEPRRLVWMVLRDVVVMTAAGLAIGIPIALATSKFVQSFLFDMKPNDPLAIAGAAAMLVIATIAAGYGPAWRASRIDPWLALRDE